MYIWEINFGVAKLRRVYIEFKVKDKQGKPSIFYEGEWLSCVNCTADKWFDGNSNYKLKKEACDWINEIIKYYENLNFDIEFELIKAENDCWQIYDALHNKWVYRYKIKLSKIFDPNTHKIIVCENEEEAIKLFKELNTRMITRKNGESFDEDIWQRLGATENHRLIFDPKNDLCELELRYKHVDRGNVDYYKLEEIDLDY